MTSPPSGHYESGINLTEGAAPAAAPQPPTYTHDMLEEANEDEEAVQMKLIHLEDIVPTESNRTHAPAAPPEPATDDLEPTVVIAENAEALTSDVQRRLIAATVVSPFELDVATENFASERELGGGGFGKVYLADVRSIPSLWASGVEGPPAVLCAVKRLSADSSQGQRELLNEIQVLAGWPN